MDILERVGEIERVHFIILSALHNEHARMSQLNILCSTSVPAGVKCGIVRHMPRLL